MNSGHEVPDPCSKSLCKKSSCSLLVPEKGQRSNCESSQRVAIPAAIFRSAQGPGPESAPRKAFECFWQLSGFWVLFEPQKCQKAFRARCPKALKKHSVVGHFPAWASGHSCKWRPGSQPCGPFAPFGPEIPKSQEKRDSRRPGVKKVWKEWECLLGKPWPPAGWENTGPLKIEQKDANNCSKIDKVFGISDVFLPYFACEEVSYSVGGQFFCNSCLTLFGLSGPSGRKALGDWSPLFGPEWPYSSSGLSQVYHLSTWKYRQSKTIVTLTLIAHPCPTYQLWPFSFPLENPPKSPRWGPQTEFPGIPQTKGFCGNSLDTLNFQESPGLSRFRILGFPFSAFWGEMKLLCWTALTQYIAESDKDNKHFELIFSWRLQTQLFSCSSEGTG